MARGYERLGEVYRAKNDFVKSIGYYKKSLEIAEIVGQRSDTLRLLETISDCYEQEGMIKESIEIQNRILDIFKTSDKSDSTLMTNKINKICDLKSKIGNFVDCYKLIQSVSGEESKVNEYALAAFK